MGVFKQKDVERQDMEPTLLKMREDARNMDKDTLIAEYQLLADEVRDIWWLVLSEEVAARKRQGIDMEDL